MNEAATELCQIKIEREKAKPEVLLKLGESGSEYRLLVIHDNVSGGAQVKFTGQEIAPTPYSPSNSAVER